MPLGRTLREARERRQMTASQLAAVTRMKVQIVEAIESENFRKIPAPIYGRGFIKLYAEAVGLDPRPLIEEYMARVNTEAAIPAPSMAVGRAATRPPAKPAVPVAQPAPAPVQAPVAPPVRTVETWLEAEPAPPPAPATPAAAPAANPQPPDSVRSAGEPQPAVEPRPAVEPEPAQGAVPVAAPSEGLPEPTEPALAVQPATSGEPPEPLPEPVEPIPRQPRQESDPDDLFAFASRVPPPRADFTPPPAESVPSAAESSLFPAEPFQPTAQAASSSMGIAPQSGSQPIQRPARTGFTVRPAPAAVSRGAPDGESDEPPSLKREHQALLQRTIIVGVAALVLIVVLIALLSRCSPPPKEVRRGPIKERLDLAVEPPAHYVR